MRIKFKQNMKILISVFALPFIVIGTSIAQSQVLEVGCSLQSWFDEPAIKFSSVESEINPDNYAAEGTLSLISEMKTKSGDWKKFSVRGSYKKVGNRLELVDSGFVRFDSDQISREEFKEIFGPLPDLKCSAF